jgi:hypothetical protein
MHHLSIVHTAKSQYEALAVRAAKFFRKFWQNWKLDDNADLQIATLQSYI